VNTILEKPAYGIEEEVFVTEPEKPSLKSLYYLAGMLKKDVRFYYTHTASNFARGKDVSQGLMSGVEISTTVHTDICNLMDDLRARRLDLATLCEGLIVPLGHLINYDAPTNVCSLQIHIGGITNLERAYKNLAYFLPLLALLTINSPGFNGQYFGQSFRIDRSFAIGPLREDWDYRFQDIIFAKRLGTIELRIFDPVWDLERVRLLMSLIDAIVKAKREYPFLREQYNSLRSQIAATGYCHEAEQFYEELNALYPVPKDKFCNTCSDQVWSFYQEEGLLNTYSALDNGYRTGIFFPSRVPQQNADLLKIGLGFAGYYIPKLPYVLWKYWREW
jgi:gamma-glutamyl:cysteine ligase YbdK (ATP-grasp superfamily)